MVVGLAVGYAVLSQQLTINGTGGIASDFNILFTDIGEGTMNGATTINKQITDSTTATFTIDLSKPGSNGEYLITVENRGTIDAMVESISGIDEANQAAPTDITFSISDIAVNDKLPAKESKVFKVKVDWSSTPTPETATEYLINNKLSSDINTSPTNGLFAIDNTGELTTSDSPREYRYIGANPDNYIQFNNELWRIIGIFDGQLKIIRDESLGKMAWDSNNVNDWSTATLQTYLNNDYYGGIDQEDQSKVDGNFTWKLGGSSNASITPQEFYEGERGTEVYEGNSTEWIGSIALMYASDYGFATSGGSTTNRSSCLTKSLYSWKSSIECYNNSWLYNNSTAQWTLTNYASLPSKVFYILIDGSVYSRYELSPSLGIHPTLYLLPDGEIASGIGTSTDPYILK